MLAIFCAQQRRRTLSSGVATAARRAQRSATTSATSFAARPAAAAGQGGAGPSARPPLPATDTVTSPSNPYVKHLAKLGTSASHRRSTGAALIAGADLVGELGAGTRARSLWLAPGQPLPPAFASPSSGTPVFTAPPPVLARIAGVESGTGVGAVAEVALPGAPAWWTDDGGGGSSADARARTPPPLPRRLLALDGVQDPGNVGALARAASALGWDGLVLLPGCADPWSAKAVRAARGAAGWRLPTAVEGGDDAAAALARLRGLADRAGLVILAADAERGGDGGAPPPSPAVPPSARGVCLLLGAEGRGLSPGARAAAASTVAIPMPGGLESLNVGQAGLVLMFALSEGGRVARHVMERLYGRGG